MVKVTASNNVKAECVEEYLAISKELVERTNADDAGCIKYELCRDVNDPLHFVMLEEWEDQASLDAHMKSAHFTTLIPKTGGMTAGPPTLTLLEKVF
ncbi:MAG: antibiotic biosynthesis monooxygenase [Oscillospiraceae bacterium]|nr:antibiotic biosynthesis monooxygenase [Oscillospiraceae bacterium]